MDRACVNQACDGIVTFDAGTGDATGDDPVRHTATCAQCSTRQFLIPAHDGHDEVQAASKR